MKIIYRPSAIQL